MRRVKVHASLLKSEWFIWTELQALARLTI
jgi:hypothetical protein